MVFNFPLHKPGQNSERAHNIMNIQENVLTGIFPLVKKAVANNEVICDAERSALRWRNNTVRSRFLRYECVTSIIKKAWIAVLLVLFNGALALQAGAAQPLPIRIGLTATFPNDQYRALEEWRRYLERRLQRPVKFVQRDSYVEAMDLLRLQKVDFAWVCEYPYLFFKGQMKLLAVPLYRGRPYYHAYLIVPARDQSTTSITQLKGTVFAYGDPYSNSGYLSPRFDLHQAGFDPQQFFRKTIFTWSHRKTVEAVASGLAQGGSVSSHVWDTLARVKPELTAATRVVATSAEFGFPPFVARTEIGTATFDDMQRVLLTMNEDEEGKHLLQLLNLDGFTRANATLYDRVDAMMRSLGER
jgi:phosphonate transport system substrate-binding protein